MTLTVQDIKQVQEILQKNHLDYQLELKDGKIILMGPSDIQSSEIGSRLIWLLMNWVAPRNLGRVLDSSGGFILSNSELKAPDVSFISAARLKQSPRYFAQMMPDLMVEIKSQSDRVPPLEEKIQLFLSLGTQVGILIDPDEETVTVYRSTEEPIVLTNADTLTIPELFPGWELAIAQIWPPQF
ncbi:Uma2 family endonuclease [Oscillatoria salina]|uniref:Uma2 family endonuclease n=1 Tax=Oscillatoria salina TaxID=331517 RepID=UPI0013B95828|nr:Uma2 family endonuclease [Oscillatoria salina]MBZ8180140.1 Uma2 family endonuclease [Oscillatoria salina IIICB1]NET90975.1 Uma2 family endonuclease [Kamptonema sp. SIO1D9]